MTEWERQDRARFDRDTLPFLRQRGFDQDADTLYQECVNWEVESEISGSGSSNDAMCQYLRIVLGIDD